MKKTIRLPAVLLSPMVYGHSGYGINGGAIGCWPRCRRDKA